MKDELILSLFETEPQKALGLLFDKYFDYLSREVNFILRNEGETEDVVQDLFMELWKKQQHLKNVNISLKYYLKRAAVNRALNKIKKRRFHEEVDEQLEAVRSVKQPNLSEIDDLEKKIKYGIDSLPPRCHIIFVLSRYENKSYKEIAQDLDISIKTVENQISKALKILREKLVY